MGSGCATCLHLSRAGTAGARGRKSAASRGLHGRGGRRERAGKSTLVKLLCGFYEPTAGTIEVDDTDLAAFPAAASRSRITAGFQDSLRLEFVARESIGVGDLTQVTSAEAALAALRRAASENLVDRLEQGLDTPLGRSYCDGAQLSGGQWQKVALGRTMMRTAPLLLILDEPTSALDAEAEHVLFEQYAGNARRIAAATGAITDISRLPGLSAQP